MGLVLKVQVKIVQNYKIKIEINNFRIYFCLISSILTRSYPKGNSSQKLYHRKITIFKKQTHPIVASTKAKWYLHICRCYSITSRSRRGVYYRWCCDSGSLVKSGRKCDNNILPSRGSLVLLIKSIATIVHTIA